MCRSGALSLNRTSSLPRCLSHNSRRLYQFGHRSHPFTDTGHDGNRPILQVDSLVFGAAVHRRCQVRQVREKANQFAPLETGRLLRTGTNDGSNSCPAVQHPSDARAVVHRTEARWIESLRSCSRCHAAESAAFLSPARRSGGEHLLPRTSVSARGCRHLPYASLSRSAEAAPDAPRVEKDDAWRANALDDAL
jgi:hypothetical protein